MIKGETGYRTFLEKSFLNTLWKPPILNCEAQQARQPCASERGAQRHSPASPPTHSTGRAPTPHPTFPLHSPQPAQATPLRRAAPFSPAAQGVATAPGPSSGQGRFERSGLISHWCVAGCPAAPNTPFPQRQLQAPPWATVAPAAANASMHMLYTFLLLCQADTPRLKAHTLKTWPDDVIYRFEHGVQQ